MAIDLELIEQDGNCLIKVKGEVDLYSSPQLRDTMLKAVSKTTSVLGLDLTGVTYMDSSGVATLVEGLKATGEQSKSFALVSPSQSVMKVLQLSRLDSVFDIKDSL